MLKNIKNNENKQQNENEDEVILSFIKTDANPYIKNRILTIDKKQVILRKWSANQRTKKRHFTYYIMK